MTKARTFLKQNITSGSFTTSHYRYVYRSNKRSIHSSPGEKRGKEME